MKQRLFSRMTGAFAALVLVALVTGCAGFNKWVNQDDLVDAIRAGSDALNQKVTGGSKVAFLNFTSQSPELSDWVIDELINNGVNDGVFTVVDRQNLAAIQQEMDFQLSGDVSDASAQSIGQKLGAQYIVSGSLTLVGSKYSFRLRAISVETAAIVATSSKEFYSSAKIRALGGEALNPPSTSTPEAAATGNYPASLAGTFYVDGADGKSMDLEFASDTLKLMGGALTCIYSYDASTGKGIIYDPAASGTSKQWGSFVLGTASGSMMTLTIDGTDIPMKQTEKTAAAAPATPATPAAPPPATPATPPPAAVPAGIPALNTWTKATGGGFAGPVSGVAFNGNRGAPQYVAVGSGGKLATSTDGATWTAQTASWLATTINFKEVIFAASSGRFIALLGNNKIYASAAGGSTTAGQWADISPSNLSPSTVMAAVIANSSQVVAVAPGSTYGAVVFRDAATLGTSWTSLTTAANRAPIAAITTVAGDAAGTKYIIGGTNGLIAYTGAALSASTTWTLVNTTTFGSSTVNDATFGANRFVAVADGGKIAYSDNGTTWKAATGSGFGTANVVSVAFGNGVFVAVAANGKIAYSKDGIAWTASTSSDFSSLSSVNFIGTKFAVGGASLIGLSDTIQ